MENRGLSTDRSCQKLISECRASLKTWESQQSSGTGDRPVITARFCTKEWLFLAFLVLSLLLIGSVDEENNISLLICFYTLLILYTLLLFFWQKKVRKRLGKFTFNKAVRTLQEFEKNASKTVIYQKELTTDDFAPCQATLRNGEVCEVPRSLLVQGDVILLKPGQAAPCDCVTIGGQKLYEGEKPERKIEKISNHSAVKPIKPVKAVVTKTPYIDHLLHSLERRKNVLDHDRFFSFLQRLNEYHLGLIFSSCSLLTMVRFFFYANEDYHYNTRYVFGIPALATIPLMMFTTPILFYIMKSENNRIVAEYLGIRDEDTEIDLVATFATITETAIVDKKGVLSPSQPTVDKVVYCRSCEEHKEDDECCQKTRLCLEAVDLGVDHDTQKLAFEDPNWYLLRKNLQPIGLNVIMNSCRQMDDYHAFLDHLNLVSSEVPRTIATANKRCMCELPQLLGFAPGVLDQFSDDVKTIGFYKRQPGDPPVPGLTRHKTPIEMAFCTLHADNRALHFHLSCQGTANMVLDASTHIWNGESVVPLPVQMSNSIRDMYHRYSMTGHCLALSYRPVFSSIGREMNGKFVELPLNRHNQGCPPAANLARTHSRDDVNDIDVLASTVRDSPEQIIEDYLNGHVFTGLAILQYEALPVAVGLIESLYNICVRPVYFSKENELRSRVFAEKLGMEAGWNCHISLEEEEKRNFFFGKEKFVPQMAKRTERGRKALSQTLLMDDDDCVKNSPTLRRTSLLSDKVAPMENKARLPAGVKNVRPHLEEVDNVPLLVGLFTDSTTESVEQMLDIMKENGESVMVIGSSRNLNNTRLFRMASVSACIDPADEPACRIQHYHSLKMSNEIDASRLASQLISVAADFHLTHESLLKLPDVIEGSRNRMIALKATLTFMYLSSLSASLVMAVTMTLFLPLIYDHSQIILTSLFHIPLLTLALAFPDFDKKNDVVRIAPKIIGHVQKAEKMRILTTFLVHFLPSVVYIVMLFILMLIIDVNILCSPPEIVCDTWQNVTTTVDADPIYVIRHVCGLQFTILLCVISASYVRTLEFSLVGPFTSRKWLMAVMAVVMTQILMSIWSNVALTELFPTLPTCLLIVWSSIILPLNETFKKFRIRQYSREQRRTKFNFDTKLGMNSPY